MALGIVVRAQFVPEPRFTVSDIVGAGDVEAADFDGDGRVDLAVVSWLRSPAAAGARASADGGRVLIFHQSAEGFVSTPATSLPAAQPTALRAGDFDHDGRTDLAVVGGRQWLHLFLGAEGRGVDHGNNNCNQYCAGPLTVGELRGAGVTDILVGPVWRAWLGGSRYRAGYFYAPRGQDANGSSWLADLNGDGTTDVVFLPHRGGKSIRLYYGPFLTMAVRPADLLDAVVLSVPLPVMSVAIADVSGDGRPDLVAGAAPQRLPALDRVLVFNQCAPMGFEDLDGPSAVIKGAGGHIACADLNGDNRADLVVAGCGTSGTAWVFHQKAVGGFAASADAADQVLGSDERNPVRALRVADMNGDQRPDIVTCVGQSARSGAVRVYLNVTGAATGSVQPPPRDRAGERSKQQR